MSLRLLTPIAFFAGALLLAASGNASAAQAHDADHAGHAAMAAPAPAVRERSIGSPTDGHLVGGSRVTESPYLRVLPTYAGEDVRYGLSELVGAIDRAAREVHRKFPDSVLSVGHLSRHGGGEIDRHASHESGRDADIGFYLKNDAGKEILEDHMVQFRGDGTSSAWPGAHFDDARNWTFIAALLSDPHVHVSHVFIATPLRARLLAYAEKIGAPGALREHAAAVVMQPHGSLPHDDHFHVRVSCPGGMSGCVELPTRPKLARRLAPIRSRGHSASSPSPTPTATASTSHSSPTDHPKPGATSATPPKHAKPESLSPVDPTPPATAPTTPAIDLAVPIDMPATAPANGPNGDPDLPIDDADGPLDDVR